MESMTSIKGKEPGFSEVFDTHTDIESALEVFVVIPFQRARSVGTANVNKERTFTLPWKTRWQLTPVGCFVLDCKTRHIICRRGREGLHNVARMRIAILDEGFDGTRVQSYAIKVSCRG